ncbi:MAG TPA: hypothetical protein VFS39_00905 [Nitrospira sp.]|nr:hypothetical protein [Nitrospira sp.]
MARKASCRTALTAFSLTAASVVGFAPEAAAADHSAAPTIVRGQVSMVQGEFQMAKDVRGEDILKMVDRSYTVTTSTGQQIELKLTRQTKVPTRANPGDHIEAKISEKGQTLSVMLIDE